MKKISFFLFIIIIQSNISAQNYNISDFVGNWSGQWNNTTFGSTGSTTMTLTSDATNMTAQMILDMNGNVLGGADPAPMTLDGTYTDTEFTVSATTDLFGEFIVHPDVKIQGSFCIFSLGICSMAKASHTSISEAKR